MCGIIGYSGHREACGILLDGLERLEYRGYDSAGILVSDNGTFHTVKRSGRLSNRGPAVERRPLKAAAAWAIPAGQLMEARPTKTPIRMGPNGSCWSITAS